MTVSERWSTIEFTFDDTWVGDGLVEYGGSDTFWLEDMFTDPVCSGSTCSVDTAFTMQAGTIRFFFNASSKIKAISTK